MTTVAKKIRPNFIKVFRGALKAGLTNFVDLGESLTDYIVDSVTIVIMAGIIGGALSTFGAYAFHLPEILGRLFAEWCATRGSCDLDTNLMSVGLGVFILSAIAILLFRGFNGPTESKQSIYFDTLEQLRYAGPEGVRAIDIAKRIGHDPSDVYTILSMLCQDGEADFISPTGNYGVYSSRYHLLKHDENDKPV